MIILDQHKNPNDFCSYHWTHYPVADNTHVVIVSGIALFHQSVADQWEWYHNELSLKISYPADLHRREKLNNGKVRYQVFTVEHWVPYLAPSAFCLDGQVQSNGWALDEYWLQDCFRLVNDHTPINLHGRFAIRGGGTTHMLRLAYHITLTGKLGWTEPQPDIN